MNRIVIIALLLFCGVTYAAIEEISKRKQVKTLLKSRIQLSHDEFAERYFPEK